jgi:hypothetical protein
MEGSMRTNRWKKRYTWVLVMLISLVWMDPGLGQETPDNEISQGRATIHLPKTVKEREHEGRSIQEK